MALPAQLVFFFSPLSSTFLIEGGLGSKNLFCESCSERPLTFGPLALSRRGRPFWRPLMAIFYFAVVAGG